MTRELIVRIHQEEGTGYWAEVLELPGCFASGRDLNELQEALEEAISLCLDDEPADVDDNPRKRAGGTPRLHVGEMRVTIPA